MPFTMFNILIPQYGIDLNSSHFSLNKTVISFPPPPTSPWETFPHIPEKLRKATFEPFG